jgi:hypothetical protein
MSVVNCGLQGCTSVIHLDGTGHPFRKPGTQIFYCSLAHQQQDEALPETEAKRLRDAPSRESRPRLASVT